MVGIQVGAGATHRPGSVLEACQVSLDPEVDAAEPDGEHSGDADVGAQQGGAAPVAEQLAAQQAAQLHGAGDAGAGAHGAVIPTRRTAALHAVSV